jgi:uncharacterized damage-inducible protein DinB
MSEIDRILGQLKQAFYGDAWHGPAVLEVLENVTAKMAAARPVRNANTIWEIVLHLIGTQTVLIRRLNSDPTDLTPEEDWPPMPECTDDNWSDTLEAMEDREEALHKLILELPPEELDKQLVDLGSSAYNNFHGHAQHNLYHAGQIVILKKMCG